MRPVSPRSAATNAGALCSSSPSTRTPPRSGHSSPGSRRSAADLPEPLLPISAVVLPAANARLTSSSASTAP